ncbi:MAG TPA: hypothetical protein VFS00_10875, partial [Polyangiaceae bacterium]|nr:hypothetical protein [Polyangiaceae bacterium]
MRHPFALVAFTFGSLSLAAGGCAPGPEGDAPGVARAALASGAYGLGDRGALVGGACGLGDEVVAAGVLTAASIPALSALQREQIVLAVQESAHVDVATVEEAFDRVDGHEVNEVVLRDAATNQFYTEIEYGAGDNSYGAVFYWGT